MSIFVHVIYIIVAMAMILAILLQAGRGGGLGQLGGGASQAVFGGGGGANFMAKLTQGFAATFMIAAMYLAYEGSHTGSRYLEEMSEEQETEAQLAEADTEIDYERIGRNPLPLPDKTPEPAAATPTEMPAPPAPSEEPSEQAEPAEEAQPTEKKAEPAGKAQPTEKPAAAKPAKEPTEKKAEPTVDAKEDAPPAAPADEPAGTEKAAPAEKSEAPADTIG